jgi:hypothetical protein
MWHDIFKSKELIINGLDLVSFLFVTPDIARVVAPVFAKVITFYVMFFLLIFLINFFTLMWIT